MKRKRADPPWTPFERRQPTERGEEVFVNSRYHVFVHRLSAVDPTSTDVCVHLSIKRNDRREIRDWRDFQRIKNELVGPEWEGIELYPAESRLVDAANQYHLWVFNYRLPIGFPGRVVSEATYGGSVQRPWDDDAKPPDLVDQSVVDRLVTDYLNKRGKEDADEIHRGDERA